MKLWRFTIICVISAGGPEVSASGMSALFNWHDAVCLVNHHVQSPDSSPGPQLMIIIIVY